MQTKTSGPNPPTKEMVSMADNVQIKCDETSPACRNCTRSNRHCPGYPTGLQKTTKDSNTLIGLQLSKSLGLQDSDRRTFDYFLSWTSPRLAGAFDRDFWCGQVLQVAHAEPVILDSLLAISALYEQPQCLQGFSTGSPQDGMALPNDSVGASALGTGRPESYSRNSDWNEDGAIMEKQHMLAVKHYNNAIAGLMDQVTSGKATLLLALLSCVLFICVELLRDNIFAALNLYTKGYQILRYVCSIDQKNQSITLSRRTFF